MAVVFGGELMCRQMVLNRSLQPQHASIPVLLLREAKFGGRTALTDPLSSTDWHEHTEPAQPIRSESRALQKDRVLSVDDSL